MFHLKKNTCKNTQGLLSAYVDGQLDPGNSRKVELHLEVCEGCRRELGELKATVARLRALPCAEPRRSFLVSEVAALGSSYPAPFPTLRAGTAVIAVFLALLFIGDIFNLFAPQPSSQGLPVSQPPVERSVVVSPSPSLSPEISSGQGFIQNLGKEAAGLWWLRPFEVGLLVALLLLGTGSLVGWRRTGKEFGGLPDS